MVLSDCTNKECSGLRLIPSDRELCCTWEPASLRPGQKSFGRGSRGMIFFLSGGADSFTPVMIRQLNYGNWPTYSSAYKSLFPFESFTRTTLPMHHPQTLADSHEDYNQGTKAHEFPISAG